MVDAEEDVPNDSDDRDDLDDDDDDIADGDGVVVVRVGVVDDTSCLAGPQEKWGGARRRSAGKTQDLQEEHEATNRWTEAGWSVARPNERQEMQQAMGICAFCETKAWRVGWTR